MSRMSSSTSLWYHTGEPWFTKSTNRKVKGSPEKGNDICTERIHCSYHMERQKVSTCDINFSWWNSMKSTGKRKSNSADDIVKITCIIQYNKHMKGSKRVDQYLANSSIYRKSVKWSKKVAFFHINCTLSKTLTPKINFESKNFY